MINTTDLFNEVQAAIVAAASLVDSQAEDEALWFHAESITEAYLQQELRKLADAVERIAAAMIALKNVRP